MIAPLRQTEETLDANKKLLARARRAVAESLLRDSRRQPKEPQASLWQSWLFAGWTLIVAVAAIGFLTGWWQPLSY
jgi:hypothetical protein